MTKTLLFSILLLCLFACKSKDQQPDEIEKSVYLEDKNQVEVICNHPKPLKGLMCKLTNVGVFVLLLFLAMKIT